MHTVVHGIWKLMLRSLRPATQYCDGQFFNCRLFASVNQSTVKFNARRRGPTTITLSYMAASQTASESRLPPNHASGGDGISSSTVSVHRSVSDSGISVASSFWKSPSPSPSPSRDPWSSGSVLAMLVLGALCLVLGSVYAYIYFTRINPRAANRAARKYVCRQAPPTDDAAQPTSTHLFLFKKSWPARPRSTLWRRQKKKRYTCGLMRDAGRYLIVTLSWLAAVFVIQGGPCRWTDMSDAGRWCTTLLRLSAGGRKHLQTVVGNCCAYRSPTTTISEGAPLGPVILHEVRRFHAGRRSNGVRYLFIGTSAYTMHIRDFSIIIIPRFLSALRMSWTSRYMYDDVTCLYSELSVKVAT